MDKHILKHRDELAEQGTEQTPAEVAEWFDDAADFFRAADVAHE